MGGILPFGASFIELFFIMNSIWASRIYYVYGFLLVVFGIILLTTSLISILVTYVALCAENYHWWWRSFFAGASCGVYVFIYGIIFFSTKLEFKDFTSSAIYFGWTAAMAGGVGLVTGTTGFLSSLIFVRKIYKAIKVD
jgi:transmembrane 9 superfamily protein 2/4